MNSRQRLIEEIQQLNQSEVLRMRSYLSEIKRAKTPVTRRAAKGKQRVRKALKSIKAALSGEMIEMRNERI